MHQRAHTHTHPARAGGNSQKSRRSGLERDQGSSAVLYHRYDIKDQQVIKKKQKKNSRLNGVVKSYCFCILATGDFSQFCMEEILCCGCIRALLITKQPSTKKSDEISAIGRKKKIKSSTFHVLTCIWCLHEYVVLCIYPAFLPRHTKEL